jgi:glycine/D-amino acid oxidase-like deaminating enzyme
MKLGGSVHQNCAARGIELEGGRVSGVVTEAGTIKTRIAVLAGGAWASSFCHQLGVRFPLATVRQSMVRLSPVEQRLPDALTSPRVAVTRRPDGHYVLAISGRGRLDPTPQLLRFAPQFIPMFAKRWRNVFPGGLEGIRWGHETRARWKLDAPTPMERARILNPKPDPAGVREIHRRALDLLPGLREARIANTWAGYIDSTPDGVPGIGQVPQVPGFILAAGFSGHGFGIGPGAGQLIADLVTGARPSSIPRLSTQPSSTGRVGQGGRFLASASPTRRHRDRPDVPRAPAREAGGLRVASRHPPQAVKDFLAASAQARAGRPRPPSNPRPRRRPPHRSGSRPRRTPWERLRWPR